MRVSRQGPRCRQIFLTTSGAVFCIQGGLLPCFIGKAAERAKTALRHSGQTKNDNVFLSLKYITGLFVFNVAHGGMKGSAGWRPQIVKACDSARTKNQRLRIPEITALTSRCVVKARARCACEFFALFCNVGKLALY